MGGFYFFRIDVSISPLMEDIEDYWDTKNTRHSHKDACGAGHLVECRKGPSQVGGGNFQDVEGIQAHHQATEDTDKQPAQDEHLKGFTDFGG